ncbi:uncharacterized protein FA14DRAFT_152486 [Meira miltonrushii]|uniref:Uncharacterized protein n=1 Tax=Meira miltonrushii TaxID=1280837 RepID=A0A316VIJ4_9BASI|nr:uncharacterized protein FA14DRAFT_152486 [Meira miltonrushii]PWN37074.1 hypothetical protein FA14DRAFT_152486 [Meira miltonrushii]
MVNSNPTIIDDTHKENAMHANQIYSSSSHVKPTSQDDVERLKPTKSQVQARKRRVLCELTDAEIQARSTPCNEEVIESQPTQSDSTTQQSSETSSLSKESHSLFKAARQARQKQSIMSKHTGSKPITNSKGSTSDKATSLQKPQRNLR